MTEVFGGYPLTWPEGVPRTSRYDRKPSAFKTTFGSARDELMEELRRLGVNMRGNAIVISSNIPTRRDGLPYAGQANPEDCGVAVYFWLRDAKTNKDVQRVLACDRYRTVGCNLHAIRLTIDALRGIKRWGTSEMFERAFTGFTALPPPPLERPWWEVLGVSQRASPDDAKAARNALARRFHPDNGSEPDMLRMAAVNRAFAESEARPRGYQ